MRDKFALTRELLKHISGDNTITYEQARTMWWYNLQQDGGLRLTALGYLALVNDVELAHYKYEIKETDIFNTRTIIDLDRKLQMPYFIMANKGYPTYIIFFGSKEAMCAKLYDDLGRFLANYA